MVASGRARPDSVVMEAVEVARDALLRDVRAPDVGAHLGAKVDGERVATHEFECLRRGYHGWRWSVTVARASRHKLVTIDEVVLVPGDDAVVAPGWLPYKERIKPGDLSPGDLLPVGEDDERLVPTWSFGDDELSDEDEAQVLAVARELGLGRVRTLSVEGRDQAAQRWYDGESGPETPIAQSAPEPCHTCGFLVRVAGALSDTFGVCANGNANDDGRVVSFDHGCGAHSEIALLKKHLPLAMPEHVYDTYDEVEILR
jgi:hypothetical protein